ncbi:MAG: hypothetical protein ACD_21C00296G0001 [uncultured bacterium]|nr:MAG: hypothetical protein ACD_21C00296G0001 [uncultured bacterium]
MDLIFCIVAMVYVVLYIALKLNIILCCIYIKTGCKKDNIIKYIANKLYFFVFYGKFLFYFLNKTKIFSSMFLIKID